MFHQKLCLRHDTWVGALLWWSCQSPGAHSCGLLNHPNGFHRGMFKLNAKSDADVLLYSLSHFEVMATQYTHSLNGMYCPHWLVHWSCYLSCAHSSPLSLAARLHWRHPNHSHYINNGWIFPGQTLFYIYTHTSIRFTYYKLYYVLTQYVCAHNIGYVYMYNLLHMLISLENPNTITVQ